MSNLLLKIGCIQAKHSNAFEHVVPTGFRGTLYIFNALIVQLSDSIVPYFTRNFATRIPAVLCVCVYIFVYFAPRVFSMANQAPSF